MPKASRMSHAAVLGFPSSPLSSRLMTPKAPRFWPEMKMRREFCASWTVQFTTATTLVAGLAKTHGERRLDEKLLALAKPKLRARLSAAGARRYASVLPASQSARRNRRHADHV